MLLTADLAQEVGREIHQLLEAKFGRKMAFVIHLTPGAEYAAEHAEERMIHVVVLSNLTDPEAMIDLSVLGVSNLGGVLQPEAVDPSKLN